MSWEGPLRELQVDVVGLATSTLGMTFTKLEFKTVEFLEGKTSV